MEKLEVYFQHAKECMEALQGMTPKTLFNNEQCGYLVDKLEVVVQRASSFLENSQAQPHGPGSAVALGRQAEIFKPLLALAKQIEVYVEGCSKEAWMQAAMTLANAAEYVSALGFNLELCRVALGEESGAAGSLTLEEVCKIDKGEADIVEKKASIDKGSLLKKATLELNSSNAEDCNLAKYLLHRLGRVGPNPNFDDDDILVKSFESVSSGKSVGRGGSATVYKVKWLGRPVAKKTFDGPEKQEFLQEVKILSQLCHPNITSMFCYNVNKRNCSIIMELMDTDLHALMQKRVGNSDSPPFSLLEGVDLMLQVGEGLNYLHDKRIVHRDLKSMNILVKIEGASESEVGYVQAKVADFGLSKTKERSTTYSNMTPNVGTSRWMAPEVINMVGDEGDHGGVEVAKHNYKCDIYSFAMVCFEILTGEVPFNSEVNQGIVKRKVLKGERPKVPDYCPSMLKCLIEQCWRQKPIERPSIGDVCSQLKYLKYLLMTGKMVQEDGTVRTMEPFEVVYLNVKNLPRIFQVQVNIFSPFLRELLVVPPGTVHVNGPELFHSYKKVNERRLYCEAKLDPSNPSSSMDANRMRHELLHILHLERFMDSEFAESKRMYEGMEKRHLVAWEMLWAFFPPREMVTYIDKFMNLKRVHGEVLRTEYQETKQGPVLLVKVTNRVTKQDSKFLTWSKQLYGRILRSPSQEKKEEDSCEFTSTITVPVFERYQPFVRLDIYPIRFEANPESREELFLRQGKLSIEEIRERTDNFARECLIYEGSCSRTYCASLRYGMAVIMVFDSSAQSDSQGLSDSSGMMRLKHENLVEFIGCCLDGQRRVLAFECATMGSLYDILHGRDDVKGAQPGRILNWRQRVKIALGAAKGLEYLLRGEAEAPVTRPGMKSRNILLFDSGNLAKIDQSKFFDLSNPKPEETSLIHPVSPPRWRRSPYNPPEMKRTGHPTQQGPIYSFGVVLLELLTGRRGYDPTLPRGQRLLVDWAAPRLTEDMVKHIMDPKLGFDYPMKEAVMMGAVAALCIQHEPHDRPNMEIVVKALESIH